MAMNEADLVDDMVWCMFCTSGRRLNRAQLHASIREKFADYDREIVERYFLMAWCEYRDLHLAWTDWLASGRKVTPEMFHEWRAGRLARRQKVH
jgi:hypothetical protein